MAIKPILFSTPMVQAIIRGDKTMTRRVVKERGYTIDGRPNWGDRTDDGRFWFGVSNDSISTYIAIKPKYKAGDVLWVRETWCELPVLPDGSSSGGRTHVYYKADGDDRPDGWRGNWQPSIFMPKAAARIFLRVKGVSAERLHDITEDQALKEGLAYEVFGFVPFPLEITARENFETLWKNLNGTRDGGAFKWENNPWVWVIEFERCEKPDNF